MTSSAPASISSFPRGHEFDRATFAVPAAQVRAYLDAVGDTNDYGNDVPPLAAVALALTALQDQIALPEGSLHTGQEVEHAAIVHVGEPMTLAARIAQRSERQGYVISIIELDLRKGDITAIRARATIMAPAGTT